MTGNKRSSEQAQVRWAFVSGFAGVRAADLAADMAEISYVLHDKSITRKLTTSHFPARFCQQQNQYEERDWICHSVHSDALKREFHNKLAKSHGKFCRGLNKHGVEPRTLCWETWMLKRRTAAAATKKTQNDAQWVRELDPQSADPRLLKQQLQSDRQFKKHAWKRGDTVAPRTMCWEPAILARRSTAKIWDARIACDDGTKSVAEYLLRGEKVPPRRRRLTGAHADST